ncbi:MAG: hypothetical protein DMG07_19460 [Acidobacteria bacterium]|nr:MAG: hypothetical protein DMG07_19460 [Acidobacteriota bacterium]
MARGGPHFRARLHGRAQPPLRPRLPVRQGGSGRGTRGDVGPLQDEPRRAPGTGGYLYETPIHLLDLARWFFGEVKDLRSAVRTCVYAEPDNFSLLVTFASGLALTFVSCAHATWAFPFERVEVFGRHFTLETTEMERVACTSGLEAATTTRDFHALALDAKRGYAGIDHNFISAVIGEEEPLVSAEDGYRSVELVDRIYRFLI